MMDSTPAQRAEAVIFDLDGTLYSLRGMKFLMTLALWRSLRFLRKLSTARALVRTREYPDAAALLADFYVVLSSLTGCCASEAEFWYHDQFLKKFVALLARRARARAGLDALLHSLKDKGVRLGVLSDFGCVAERLDALGIDTSQFDSVCSSEDFGALKPSPAGMLAMAKKWNITPGRVLVVGDRSDMDAVGAAAAGMRFVGILNKAKTAENGFVSWTQALEIIEARTNLE